jgi:hypothetical protein
VTPFALHSTEEERAMPRLLQQMSILTALTAIFTAAAQPQAGNVKEAVNVIVVFCVAGGDRYSIDASGQADGGIALRKFGATAGGEIKISKSEARGLVDGLNASLNNLSAQQASEARKCMQPYIDRILDTILPRPQVNQNQQQSTTPAVVDASWSISMPVPSGWPGFALNMPSLPQGWFGPTCRCARPTVMPTPQVPFQANSIVEFINQCAAAVDVAIAKLESTSAGGMPSVARTQLHSGSVFKANVGGALGLAVLVRQCPSSP